MLKIEVDTCKDISLINFERLIDFFEIKFILFIFESKNNCFKNKMN